MSYQIDYNPTITVTPGQLVFVRSRHFYRSESVSYATCFLERFKRAFTVAISKDRPLGPVIYLGELDHRPVRIGDCPENHPDADPQDRITDHRWHIVLDKEQVITLNLSEVELIPANSPDIPKHFCSV